MSHFEDAKTLPGVNIVFRFDQTKDHEISDIFSASDYEFALDSGVCAGLNFDLLHEAIIHPDITYSRDIMKLNSDKIIALQKYLREKNLSLASFLERLAMQHYISSAGQLNRGEDNLLQNGIHLFSHRLSAEKGGNHVAMIIVREIAKDRKEVVFFDALKGMLKFNIDTVEQADNYRVWVEKYLDIYQNKIGAKTTLHRFSLTCDARIFSNVYDVITHLDKTTSEQEIDEKSEADAVIRTQTLFQSTKKSKIDTPPPDKSSTPEP